MNEPILASDLWVDQPDAGAHIDYQLRRGLISQTQAERLRKFVDTGYLTFPIEIDPDLYEALDSGIDRLWKETPVQVGFARSSPRMPMSQSTEHQDRKPGYRLCDLHFACHPALLFCLNRSLFEYVELIFGQPAVVIQSLYFEYGSHQLLHRDPIVVGVSPPSHLIAAWIPLEDIHPASGPLNVIPGSHRVPYYEFSPGQIMYDPDECGDDELSAGLRWYRQRFDESNLKPEPYLPKRGEVLLWHHSLFHFGSQQTDLERTHKSLVVHFSTLREGVGRELLSVEGRHALRGQSLSA